jgi:hypothetical protein
MKYIPLGTVIEGKLKVVSGDVQGKRVRMALYRRDRQTKKMVGVTDQNGEVTMEGQEAKYKWNTAGVVPDDELGCEIGWDIWLNSDPQGGNKEKLFLYRQRLEVAAIDGQGAPVPRALCRLSIVVDEGYAASKPKYAAPADREGDALVYKVWTNDQGIAVFDRLPYGRVTVEWTRPHVMAVAGWIGTGGFTTTGWKRKATIEERGIAAAFVWPATGGLPVDADSGLALHTQYVNLDKSPATDADHGRVMKVKVKVAAPRQGIVGDILYLKVEPQEGNSARTADPRASFEGRPLLARAVVIAKRTLTADDGSVEFPVDLGPAGCDRFKLSVGGSPTTFEQSIMVTTRRRLNWRVAHPVGCAVVPTLPAAVEQGVVDLYKEVGIDLVRVAPIAAPQAASYAIITGAQATTLGLDPNVQHLVYTQENPEKAFLNNNSDARQFPAYPPCLHLVLGANVVYHSDEEMFLFDGSEPEVKESSTTGPRVSGRSRKSIKSAGGGAFLRKKLDGSSAVLDWQAAVAGKPPVKGVPTIDPKTGLQKKLSGTAQWDVEPQKGVQGKPQIPSHWYTSADDTSTWGAAEWTAHTIDDTFLVIDDDKLAFTFKYPDTLAGRPGIMTKSTVKLRVQVFSSQGGSSSGRWLCAFAHAQSNVNRAIYALAHEIGHCLGLTVVKIKDSGVGEEADNDYAYEHSGSHCSYGLSKSQRDEEQWSRLRDRGIRSDCLMFSPVGPKTKYDTVVFCEQCLRHLKALEVEI